MSTVLVALSWLLAPFIYNPYQFMASHFASDLQSWKAFFWDDGCSHWIKWYSGNSKSVGGARAADALFWAGILLTWYLIMHEQVNLFLTIGACDHQTFVMHQVFLLLPPVFCSLAACIVLQACCCSDQGTQLKVAAPLVFVLDFVEANAFSFEYAHINGLSSIILANLAKYSLISLAIWGCESLFRHTGSQSRNCSSDVIRCWLYAHRLARDLAVSSLILLLLSPWVFLGMLQPYICLAGISLHNLLLYRSPLTLERGKLGTAREILHRQATGSPDSWFTEVPASDRRGSPVQVALEAARSAYSNARGFAMDRARTDFAPRPGSRGPVGTSSASISSLGNSMRPKIPGGAMLSKLMFPLREDDATKSSSNEGLEVELPQFGNSVPSSSSVRGNRPSNE